MSSVFSAPPEISVADIALNALVTPVLSPSFSPEIATSTTTLFGKLTTGGSSPQPASISYCSTYTVV